MTEPRKEPAWLVAKVDQLEARLEQSMPAFMFELADTIMIQLEEPPADATDDEIEAWGRSCSKCGTFCAGEFYLGQVLRPFHGRILSITLGLCPTCKEIQ